MPSGIAVIAPPREFTGATVEAFDASVEPHVAECRAMVIDLFEVTFISSAGLSRLVHLGRVLSARGARLVLARARRNVLRLIQTVGLDVVMPVFDSIEETGEYLLRPEAGEETVQ